MRFENKINRRTRQRLYLAAGVLSLALWLFMAFAETHQSLHAWLHGGTVPDGDDCAIVALAHGNVETVTPAAPAVVPTTSIEVTPQIDLSVFSSAIAFLPNGRGPPALPAVS